MSIVRLVGHWAVPLAREIAALLLVVGGALQAADAWGEDSGKSFEDGKALGKAMTGPQVTELQSGRTTSEVPNYTDEPPEKTYYKTQDLKTPRSQQQASCAATPNDPTCTGIAQGTQPRPPSNVTRADPALAGEDAAMNPSKILGDIATTYTACSVGTPTLITPAQFSRQACTSTTAAWTSTDCDKTLSVVPHTRTSCEQGSWVATADGKLGDQAKVDASALCDVAPRDGLTTFRLGVNGTGRQARAASQDIHLSMAAAWPALGEDPPKVATLQLLADWMGSSTYVDVYAYGPGCVGDDCAMGFHYFQGGVQCSMDGEGGMTCSEVQPGFLEARYACPGSQLAGNELVFVSCTPGPDGDVCTDSRGDRHQCWAPAQSRGAALAHPLGSDQLGYWTQAGASTPTQQAIVVPSQPAGQPMTSLSLSFSRPRVLATAGEAWDNGCAAWEGVTPQLPADGVTAPGEPVLPSPMPVGQRQCVRTASVCLDGPSTHLIDGEEITRACWHWQNTFDCTALTAGSTCTDPEFAACSRAGEFRCTSDDGQGHCLASTADYDCKTADAVYSEALNCGEQVYCAGGSCYDTTYTPNDKFGFAVAHLEARVEGGLQFDPSMLEIFKGSPGHCDKDTYGLRDCCDADGDFLQCEADERETVRQRELGQCHYIGSYCSERDFLGGCLARTYSYCCFPSMLARIVQEQGRPQLERDWGSSRKPSCEGFTVEEFQNLDWSRIDLSEFYASITPAPADNDGSTDRAGDAQDNCYYGTGRCGP